jgi:hypothetical protein
MTEQQKQSLYIAIKTSKVTSSVPPELIYQPAQLKPTTSPVQPPLNIQMPKSLNDLGVEARAILDGNVSDIKKTILVSSDLRLLRMLLALESGGKDRVTLTKLLTDQISQLEQKAVAASQKIEPGPKPILIDPARIKLPGQKAVDYSVDEEAGETVTLVYDKKEGN